MKLPIAGLLSALLWTSAVFAVAHDTFLKRGALKAELGLHANVKENKHIAHSISIPRSNPGFSINPRDNQLALLGINCKGSILCNGFCPPTLQDIQDIIKDLDDNKQFGNGNGAGHKIACALCDKCGPNIPNCPFPSYIAICVFPQKMPEGKTVSGKEVKDKVQELLDNDCKRCGGAPIWTDDVNDGEITVNYVFSGCEGGICPDNS